MTGFDTLATGAIVDLHNLVVARYLDGRVIKGVTHDFSATRPMLHIELDGAKQVVEVRLRQLKALFFVKSFDGTPERDDVRGFIAGPAEQTHGRKIAVRFRDGEFLCGYTMSWTPDREGFFLFPADASSNNARVWVVVASTLEVKAGPQAEALAQRTLAADAARGTGGAPGRPAAPGSGSGNSTIGPRPGPPPRSNAA
jgi:hypothetical protein